MDDAFASCVIDHAMADVAQRRDSGEHIPACSIVVVDNRNVPIRAASEADVGMLRFDIARGKTGAALGMGMSSAAVEKIVESKPLLANFPAIVPVQGAILIRDKRPRIHGAVAMSGSTSDVDETICKRALNACRSTH